MLVIASQSIVKTTLFAPLAITTQDKVAASGMVHGGRDADLLIGGHITNQETNPEVSLLKDLMEGR